MWFGLYGTRARLGVAVAVVAAEFSAPIPFLDLPTEEWRRAAIWSVTAPCAAPEEAGPRHASHV